MTHSFSFPPRFGAMAMLIAFAVIQTIGCGDSGETSQHETRGASVAVPTIEGPITGAPFLATTTFELAQVGYEQAEYFISGTAAAFTTAEPLTPDGVWTTITSGETAPYKTRLVVYRPTTPAAFNGTVIVEWLNVTNCIDLAPVWINAHTELVRSGYAWVGVSAQSVGVEGVGRLVEFCPAVFALKRIKPTRYGSLVHPGDSFAYDIFSQAAQAIRRPGDVSPLGDLPVQAVIAVGQSQSAHRLVTYIDAVHPLADIYDGFFVHGRGASPSVEVILSLSEPPQPEIYAPGPTHIRGDLNVPVLNLQPETFFAVPVFEGVRARQDDGERFRQWDLPGSADADTYLLMSGLSDRGASPSVANLLVTSAVTDSNGNPLLSCDAPLNSGPQHFVVNAAIAALDGWVRDGTPPPTAPRIDFDQDTIVRDDNGNALGGVRTPQLDVPIATLSGASSADDLACQVFGSTVPFDADRLRALYRDHDDYVAQFNAATERAVAAGFILPPDAELMRTAAAESVIPHLSDGDAATPATHAGTTLVNPNNKEDRS